MGAPTKPGTADGSQAGVKPGSYVGTGTQENPEAYGTAWDEQRAQERFSYGNDQQNPLMQQQVDQVRGVGNAAAGNVGQAGNNALGYGLTQSDAIAGQGRAAGVGIANSADAAGNAISAYGQQQGGDIKTYGTNTANQLQSYGTNAAQGIQGQAGGLTAYGQALGAGANGFQGRTGPQADLTGANAAQGQAGGYANQLAGVEAQQGPSAAQAQLQAGLNQSAAQNLAMARSGRGWGGSASALTQASAANAAQSQGAVNSSAILRAQEDAAYRQRMASNLTAAGGLQANLGQAYGQQGLGQAQLDAQQRGLNDQAMLNQQQQGIAAQQAGIGASTAGAQLGANSIQAAGNLGVGAQQAGAGVGLQGLQGGAAVSQAGNIAGAQINQQGLMGSAGVGQNAYGQQIGTTTAGAQLQMGGEQMGQNIYQAQLNAGIAREGQGVQQSGINSDYSIRNDQNAMQWVGAISGGMGGAVGAMSDKNTKKNITPEDGFAVASSLNPVSYDYKDPKYGEGRQLGIIAQDLEKTPAGKDAIIKTSAGRMVDQNKGAMLALAGVAGLADKFADLEAQIAKLKKKAA